MTLLSLPALAGKYSNAVAAAGRLQGRVLWCDAEANLFALDTREKVADLVNHCKDANINVVVVDVKPLCGLVLYKSSVAPKLKEWKGKPYPADYDLLNTMVTECRRAGIEVFAAINVFSEGQVNIPGGPAYAHPDWQCVKYESDVWAQGTTQDQYPVNGTNVAPTPGRLNLITTPAAAPKEIAAGTIAVSVDSNKKVVAVADGSLPPSFALTAGGFILVASGPAGDWLRKNNQIGSALSLVSKPRFVPVAKAADQHLAVFVNPSNPEVRSYEMAVVKEIVSNYDVDGIVFDRMRYPGMYADFSDTSRQAFEKWLGAKVEKWPEDVFGLDPMPGRDIIQGKYFAQWMEWRAKQIHDFVSDARTLVKSVKPAAKVAAYVGSWYSSYYDVGVNWASPKFQPPYTWARPSYKDTGYADLMDWLCTGCYYEYATKDEAKAAGADAGGTVEAAGDESNATVADDTFVYASIYLLQYAKKPEEFEKAIATCNATTQGVMLFDLCYIRDYNWWDVLKRAFSTNCKAPHQVPGLIDKVKEVKSLVEGSSKP